MIIAIKFDNEGKLQSYCSDLSVRTKDQILPSSEGFEFYDLNCSIDDVPFLVLSNGRVEIDEVAKALSQNDHRKRLEHAKLKEELKQIKEDIEQETFGFVRSDYDKKKARAAEIINELRVLEGKEPRECRYENN